MTGMSERTVPPAAQRAARTAVPGRDALARAVLVLPLTALAPDGRLAPAVLDRVIALCAAAPMLAGCGPGPLRAFALAMLREMAAQGAGPVLSRVVPALDPPMAETALCLAVRAALDGQDRLAPRDRQVLGALARRLGLDPALVEGMAAVLSVLDRPAP